MIPQELEQLLRTQIPLAAAMEVSVRDAGDESVLLEAPLAPNINPHGTVFGGSASTLAILAAWSVVHVRLKRAGLGGREMIQSNTMEYLHPITGAFTARATISDPQAWEGFVRTLARKGRGRVEVSAVLQQGEEVVGRLTAQLVAFNESH